MQHCTVVKFFRNRKTPSVSHTLNSSLKEGAIGRAERFPVTPKAPSPRGLSSRSDDWGSLRRFFLFYSLQKSITATSRTSRAQTQATTHWFTTIMVAHLPPSSRLTAATAAMQGVYSRQNTSRGAACAGVKAAYRAAVEPKRISRVDTTLSLAIKPVMRAVDTRQSAKPRGANSGAMSPAICARMLSCG